MNIETAFENWLCRYYPGVRGPRGALVEGLEGDVKAAFTAGAIVALGDAADTCRSYSEEDSDIASQVERALKNEIERLASTQQGEVDKTMSEPCCKRCGMPERLHGPKPDPAVDDGFGGETFKWWHPFELNGPHGRPVDDPLNEAGERWDDDYSSETSKENDVISGDVILFDERGSKPRWMPIGLSHDDAQSSVVPPPERVWLQRTPDGSFDNRIWTKGDVEYVRVDLAAEKQR